MNSSEIDSNSLSLSNQPNMQLINTLSNNNSNSCIQRSDPSLSTPSPTLSSSSMQSFWSNNISSFVSSSVYDLINNENNI